jgi:hypothetical protein
VSTQGRRVLEVGLFVDRRHSGEEKRAARGWKKGETGSEETNGLSKQADSDSEVFVGCREAEQRPLRVPCSSRDAKMREEDEGQARRGGTRERSKESAMSLWKASRRSLCGGCRRERAC